MEVVDGAPQITDAALVSRFESLGGGCEFGVFQRFCAAEPLGLFRFTASRIENLIDVLSRGLDGFLDEADLDIWVWPDDNEYLVRSRRYGDFNSHTGVRTRELSADLVRERELKKTSFLKRQFLKSLQRDNIIYVRCGDERLEDVLSLHAILNRHKPAILLWVSSSDSPLLRGTVKS